MLTDTHPDAEKVQIELIRQATVGERIGAMRSLTTIATNLSRRGIAKANPSFTPQEVNQMWVELHYGKELAQEFREYCSEKK
jgi:hypothetical protein